MGVVSGLRTKPKFIPKFPSKPQWDSYFLLIALRGAAAPLEVGGHGQALNVPGVDRTHGRADFLLDGISRMTVAPMHLIHPHAQHGRLLDVN